MAYTHSRFGSTLALLLLGCTALGSTAQAGWLFGDSKKEVKKESGTESVKAGTAVQPAETLDGSIRQAQLLRVDGNYSEAIRHLSQLMMVASDDHRVINEYGKTLAAMGRASEAVNFLTRAQQLQPGDWTVYSALGVAYDQMGKQQEAKNAYEQALTLKPGEPSVLNNYALSRLLANDPDEAHRLIARAEIAGGASDPKIARNIAMIRDVAPASAKTDYAVTKPAPSPRTAIAAPSSPAPRTTVAAAPLPAATVPAAPRSAVSERNPQPQRTANAALPAPFVNLPTPPAPAPVNTVIEARPQLARTMTPAPQGVVMQRVPFDPLAGPVAVAIPKPPVATRAPRTLAPKPDVARVQATPTPVKAAAAPAPAPAKKAEAPHKTAATAAQDLQARAEAIAKQMEAEKARNAQATKTAAAAKPAPKPAAPVKAAAKPAPAKQTAKPTATAAKSAKDSVPALRLSANAF